MLSIYLKLWSIGRGHVESIQAAAQLARCVDQRMSGCRLLAKVERCRAVQCSDGAQVGPGGGEESETTPPVQNSALQTDHRSAVVRQASHQQQISHSLIEEHKVRRLINFVSHIRTIGHHHSGRNNGGVPPLLGTFLHHKHRPRSLQGYYLPMLYCFGSALALL